MITRHMVTSEEILHYLGTFPGRRYFEASN